MFSSVLVLVSDAVVMVKDVLISLRYVDCIDQLYECFIINSSSSSLECCVSCMCTLLLCMCMCNIEQSVCIRGCISSMPLIVTRQLKKV